MPACAVMNRTVTDNVIYLFIFYSAVNYVVCYVVNNSNSLHLSRGFYPKQFTMHSRFNLFVYSLGIYPMTSVLLLEPSSII